MPGGLVVVVWPKKKMQSGNRGKYLQKKALICNPGKRHARID